MKRQTCANCLRTVGTLPSGETRNYDTDYRDDGRRFHYCEDMHSCEHARQDAQMGSAQ